MTTIGWFEIYVKDMERAVMFYNTVFNIELEAFPAQEEELEMFVFPAKKGTDNPGGALVKADFNGPSEGGTIIYFSCEDCAIEQGIAEMVGGEVIVPKKAIGEDGFFSLIKDSEGNTIGLHSKF